MITVNGITISDDERQPVECWSRIMGYFRPISDANIGKQSEFKERKYFTEEKAQESDVYKSFDKEQKVA